MGNVGGDMVAMLMHFFFGLTVVCLIELGTFSFLKFDYYNGKSDVRLDPDNDVIAEEMRV